MSKMSPSRPYIYATPQNTPDEELFDDSTGVVPMIGLKTPMRLRNRFLGRLSKMVGANARLDDNESQQSIDVFLTRSINSPQGRIELDIELGELLQCMEQSLSIIATHHSGFRYDEALEDLWDAIIIYSSINLDHIVDSIDRAFMDNEKKFNDFITRMFGINDHDKNGSALDRELGEHLISLHHAIKSYDKSLKQLHELIQLASNMTKSILHLQIRLKHLLRGTKFGNDIHDLIFTLGFPERVYGTLIRAAKSSPAFARVTFHLQPNTPSLRRVHFSASPSNSMVKPTSSPTKSIIKSPATTSSAKITPANASSTPARTAIKMVSTAPSLQQEREIPKKKQQQPAEPTHSEAVWSQESSILDVIQPYLALEDKSLGLAQLQTASKQDTAQLIGSMLRGKLLPKSSNAWYTFGFVTTQDAEEERRLGGLYVALLQEAQTSTSIFLEITQAVESTTLVDLFDKKEYAHFRRLFPRLESFLTTPPTQRSTVWRLKQFLHDEGNDEPPACLQRDYGFKFCRQREEVQLLKSIYTRILDKVEPLDLHKACVCGQLHQFAMQRGIYVDLKDRRLMQNDCPAPSVGFDNGEGLAAYGLLFKRSYKL